MIQASDKTLRPELHTFYAGDCVGESFYSTERFPVIPPFGAPELAGMYGVVCVCA